MIQCDGDRPRYLFVRPYRCPCYFAPGRLVQRLTRRGSEDGTGSDRDRECGVSWGLGVGGWGGAEGEGTREGQRYRGGRKRLAETLQLGLEVLSGNVDTIAHLEQVPVICLCAQVARVR